MNPQLPATPLGRTVLLLIVLAAIEPVRRWMKEADAREAKERAIASAMANNRSRRGSVSSSRGPSRVNSLSRFSGMSGVASDDSPGKWSNASSVESPSTASLGSAYSAFDADDDDGEFPFLQYFRMGN